MCPDTPDSTPSDLTGCHFNWSRNEAWVSLRGTPHYEQATVIYTGVVLYDSDDRDEWWVSLTNHQSESHYDQALIRGARLRPWIAEYERLNPHAA